MEVTWAHGVSLWALGKLIKMTTPYRNDLFPLGPGSDSKPPKKVSHLGWPHISYFQIGYFQQTLPRHL